MKTKPELFLSATVVFMGHLLFLLQTHSRVKWFPTLPHTNAFGNNNCLSCTELCIRESNVHIMLHLPLPCPQATKSWAVSLWWSVMSLGGIVVLILEEFQVVVKLNVQLVGEISHC